MIRRGRSEHQSPDRKLVTRWGFRTDRNPNRHPARSAAERPLFGQLARSSRQIRRRHSPDSAYTGSTIPVLTSRCFRHPTATPLSRFRQGKRRARCVGARLARSITSRPHVFRSRLCIFLPPIPTPRSPLVDTRTTRPLNFSTTELRGTSTSLLGTDATRFRACRYCTNRLKKLSGFHSGA
jgi:hypothetical protein